MSSHPPRSARTLSEKVSALVTRLPRVRRAVLGIVFVALFLFIPITIMPGEINEPFLALYALTLGLFGIPLLIGALIADLKEVLRPDVDARGSSSHRRT